MMFEMIDWNRLPGWMFAVILGALVFVAFVWWDHRNLG